MTASTIFFLLLVLACPLMMMFMMRGGHGHGGQGGHAGGSEGARGQEPTPRETSTDDLRRQRAELDRVALFAGFGGKAIFFALGLLLSVPMLRRLYRRFGTPVAPGLALVVFA